LGAGLRVLVVEDEYLICQEMVGALAEAGFHVLEAAPCVDDALAFLQGARPDAAILDGRLRGEWVTPVAARLQEMDVPFVLASAYSVQDLAGQPLLASARNLGKPTAYPALFDVLRELCRQR
jgi:DNA-binding response OmpR family regulator